MKIGIVCPYGWDMPGGVQFHVRDLAIQLMQWGHEVSVLTPAPEDEDLPPWVVSAGRPLPVPYNGSVARLAFGPLVAARIRKWIDDGDFDVLHIHEPPTPSLSIIACWIAEGPMVGTFHTSTERSRALTAASPILEPAMEKLSLRIAVSQAARDTAIEHLGREVIVIPNGVDVSFFSKAPIRPELAEETLLFIGRFEESRKGLAVLLDAMPEIIKESPGVRLLIAGPGDPDEVLADLSPEVAERCIFLGKVTDEEKASLLRSVTAYIAPNIGGESFGIIIAEAMAAGAPVVASDIEAFTDVLNGAGMLFRTGDPSALAKATLTLLRDPEQRRECSRKGTLGVQRFDWSYVAAEILAVYETVVVGQSKVVSGGDSRWRSRLTRRGDRR
jgi:phosphatidyl-myo-inositol alpha-mannosyltransferase